MVAHWQDSCSSKTGQNTNETPSILIIGDDGDKETAMKSCILVLMWQNAAEVEVEVLLISPEGNEMNQQTKSSAYSRLLFPAGVALMQKRLLISGWNIDQQGE